MTRAFLPRSYRCPSAGLRIRAGIALLTGLLAACDDGAKPAVAGDTTVQDSAATASEVRASLAGEGAPRGEAYSYRTLYAGLTQAGMEQRIVAGATPDSTRCVTDPKAGGDLTCHYDAPLGPDHALVTLDVAYAAGADPSGRMARTITVTRALPLDVDGVTLAKALADAFERQTTFLDRREASYGHHQAQIRMGSVNASRLNYVDVSVMPVHGREILTVKMSRALPARAPAARVARPSSPVQSPAHGRGKAPAVHRR